MEQVYGKTPINFRVKGKSKVLMSIAGFTKLKVNEKIIGNSALSKKIIGLSKVDLEDRT